MVAHEDDLVELMIVMMSLTFMYGFIKKWWSTVVNVVLEKKKDAQKIHQLQTIGILEAAFNTALKILFTKKLMAHAECTGLYEEQQWGYRQARTFTGPSLRKMTSFEYGCYMNMTIAVFLSDQTACLLMGYGLQSLTYSCYSGL